jgi:hypothetical protein
LGSVVGLLLLAAAGCFTASDQLQVVPAHGGCDVVVDPARPAATLAQLNDAGKRVFCVDPGDYRRQGMLVLSASGTESRRRFLRFNAPDPLPVAVRRPERAVFESIRIHGSWWVIQGLTIQPRDPATDGFVSIQGGDRNVLDGNLVDGSMQPNEGRQRAILIASLQNDPATWNFVQRNVIRSGNRSRLPVDYSAVAVSVSVYPGGNNDFNRILDNEIYDWGDGVQLAGGSDCNYVARPRGTLIDGNDIYVTAAKRVDCADGTPDPDGQCSCSENGIDVKPDPGTHASFWTRITNNRLWGFRPTGATTCGGSGSNGQAINAGNQCPGHVLVASNVIGDSTVGIAVRGPKWTIVGNLFHDIRRSSVPAAGGIAILPLSGATGLQIQFNTVVGVDGAYDDASDDTDTRCTVVVGNLAVKGEGSRRGSNHSTRYNFLYDSPPANFAGATNQTFADPGQSRNEKYCFWRRRWTHPERICIPFAHTSLESTHLSAARNCRSDLGEPFGLGPIGWF